MTFKKFYNCLFFSILYFSVTLLFCPETEAVISRSGITAGRIENIRILVDTIGKNKTLTISCHSNSPLQVVAAKDIAFTIEDKKINISHDGKNFIIGPAFFHLKEKNVELKLDSPSDYFTYKTYKLYGPVRLLLEPSGNILLIHTMPLENYVSRCVLGELSARTPLEALKAQAVSSRTYSLYNILEHKTYPYDIAIHYQAFGPNGSKIRAVRDTEGMVLSHKGRVIPAFFSQNCGGFTEKAFNVWQTRFSYSEAVKSPYGKNTKNFSWDVTFKFSDIEARLKKAGYAISDITGVSPNKKDEDSQRVLEVLVKSEKSSYIIPSNTFRLLMGSKQLKSTLFTTKNLKDRVEFIGFGFGHGVGMCQDGATEMAELGKTFDDILDFYFPDTELIKVY
jgi:stage II sporulation protein D